MYRNTLRYLQEFFQGLFEKLHQRFLQYLLNCVSSKSLQGIPRKISAQSENFTFLRMFPMECLDEYPKKFVEQLVKKYPYKCLRWRDENSVTSFEITSVGGDEAAQV